MNVKQMVILSIVVVVLVFVVAFASHYLGEGSNPNTQPASATKPLVFAEEKVEPKKPNGDPGGPLPLYELHNQSHHDFWFENKSGQEVRLGLMETSCKCSKVEVGILPEEQWKALSSEQRKEPSADMAWKQLLEAAKGGESVKVPPGTAGWVRLGWKGDTAGQQNMTATFLMQLPKGERSPTRLEIPVLFVEPVVAWNEERVGLVEKAGLGMDEKDVGKLEAGTTAQANFICFSLTRADFNLEPEPGKTPCIDIGKPVKLNDKERADLTKAVGSSVLCAYRVPVTVREQVGDHQLDLGLFRYQLKLKPNTGTELSVYILGQVDGPITMGEQGLGRINLDKFRANEGIKRPISFFGSDPHLELELDGAKTRRTEFLHVSEPKVTAKNAEGKSWEIVLTIKPGTVDGPFPDRPSDPSVKPKPGHEDCAIYLRVGRPGAKPEEWRQIRIPVYGNATR